MTQTNDAPAGLREALAAAAAAFVRGNAEPLKALFSHRDDVTILGAFGGFEQGWDLVGPRLAIPRRCLVMYEPVHAPYRRHGLSGRHRAYGRAAGGWTREG